MHNFTKGGNWQKWNKTDGTKKIFFYVILVYKMLLKICLLRKIIKKFLIDSKIFNFFPIQIKSYVFIMEKLHSPFFSNNFFKNKRIPPLITANNLTRIEEIGDIPLFIFFLAVITFSWAFFQIAAAKRLSKFSQIWLGEAAVLKKGREVRS